MAGGATGGYWEMGNCVIATAPITMMNSAMTHAKMGRSMKNLAMGSGPQLQDFAAEAGADAGLAAGAVPAADHGTGFTGAFGRSFWKPSTITCSPDFRPSSTTHCVPWLPPSLTVRGATLPSPATTMTVSPVLVRATAC